MFSDPDRNLDEVATINYYQPREPDAPELSDDWLTQRFVCEHCDDLRYCEERGTWLRWNGHKWQCEKTLLAFDRARLSNRAAASELADEDDVTDRDLRGLASAKTRAAVVSLAKADRAVAVAANDLDKDRMFLACPGLAIDLEAHRQRANKPEDFNTRAAGFAPAEGKPSKWLAFLGEVMDGDAEMVAYLQRVAGYCLTGNTSEHVLFFCYGTGRNGKSVMIEVLADVLGDYAETANMQAFTGDSSNRHLTEIAKLDGARLVTAVETEAGRPWAESRIKTLTGGDKVSARFMRKDEFVFSPQFKLMVAGNHKPTLACPDEAMRRRIQMIPFEVTIPPDRVDRQLKEKLLAEGPQILAWALEGLKDWQRIGLAPTERVLAASSEYMAEEDCVAAWLEECVDRSSGTEGTADLIAHYTDWAKRNGMPTLDHKLFASRLRAHGFTPHRTNRARGFKGLTLIHDIPAGLECSGPDQF
ncbi:phage/plasmid primase, P4 family [Parvularcula marina]|nr:phage/plasmid primase, P4 family [Parvularcula marina]